MRPGIPHRHAWLLPPRTVGIAQSKVLLDHGSKSLSGMLRPTQGQYLKFSDTRSTNAIQLPSCTRRVSNLHDLFIMQHSGFSPLSFTGTSKRCLNLGSYNYLGFAAADEYCTPRVQDTLKELGISSCSSRMDAGIWKGPLVIFLFRH